MTSDPVHRYAIYFAPRVDSPWWRAGSRWLGRCASRLEPLPQAPLPGVPAPELHRLTKAPRRYGWHATLKAPFALAAGVDDDMLRGGLRAICENFEPFTLPPLKVAMLDDFLALVPDENGSRAIDDIAAACVTRLQPLAAALTPAELERRRAGGLTQEEDALLVRWGYPFVLDRFRFHLSLTGSLRDATPSIVPALADAARHVFGALPACRFDTISLFAEPKPGADFVLVEQMELGA